MKLTFLGSGSAFSTDNYQSNMLIETADDKKMLYDCGGACHSSIKCEYLGIMQNK